MTAVVAAFPAIDGRAYRAATGTAMTPAAKAPPTARGFATGSGRTSRAAFAALTVPFAVLVKKPTDPATPTAAAFAGVTSPPPPAATRGFTADTVSANWLVTPAMTGEAPTMAFFAFFFSDFTNPFAKLSTPLATQQVQHLRLESRYHRHTQAG